MRGRGLAFWGWKALSSSLASTVTFSAVIPQPQRARAAGSIRRVLRKNQSCEQALKGGAVLVMLLKQSVFLPSLDREVEKDRRVTAKTGKWLFGAPRTSFQLTAAP